LTSALFGGSGQFHALIILPLGKEPPVPILYYAGWASEPVWTLWSGGKPLAHVGNRTPGRFGLREKENIYMDLKGTDYEGKYSGPLWTTLEIF
jgi:hypothetical protein